MLDPMLRPPRQIMLNRRILILVLALLVLAVSSFASKKEKEGAPPSGGLQPSPVSCPEDYNWRGADDHTLSGIIWYPAEDSDLGEKDQYIGLADAPLFYAGRAAKDATSSPQHSAKFPLVALSHGTGGSALQMAWLGTHLAARAAHRGRGKSSWQQRRDRVYNQGLHRRLGTGKRHQCGHRRHAFQIPVLGEQNRS